LDCGVTFDIGSLRDARQMQPWNRKAACFDTPLLLILADAILRKVLHQSCLSDPVPLPAIPPETSSVACVFRGDPASDSESIRPPIPILSGH
jgi:hypothetical protein